MAVSNDQGHLRLLRLAQEWFVTEFRRCESLFEMDIVHHTMLHQLWL